MRFMTQAKFLVVAVILVPVLAGCMAIPMAVGAKAAGSSARTALVSGPQFPEQLFREAAIKAGGVVTVATDKYAKGEFHETSVVVELQEVKGGEYQLVGRSTEGMGRMFSFTNHVKVAMQKITEHLAANEYKVVEP